jgi:hypothetical protein
MTNATKTLSIIFVILAAVTGAYSWMNQSGTSEGLRTKLVEINPDAIDKIVIDNKGRDYPVTLQKEGDIWKVTSREGDQLYPASSQAIASAMEQLNSLNIKALVTRDPKKHVRYQVDSTGTDVTLYRGDTEAAHVILGKPQFVSRSEFNTYMRRADEPEVYSVEGFISAAFNKDIENWRDKQVWKLDRNEIDRVDLLFPADSSYSIERAGQEAWTSNGDSLKTRLVDSMINQLTNLRANGFVNETSPSDFGKEVYAMQVQLSNGVQRTLRIKPDPDQKSTYQAVASDFPYVFTLNKNSIDNSVLKGRKAMLR